jgi:hypothetical protein
MSKSEPTSETSDRFREMTKRIVNTPREKVDGLAKEWGGDQKGSALKSLNCPSRFPES